jgi:hypothetical protein
MPGQSWSHLILTGLNEGHWPRAYEAGAFGSRHELMELNRRAGELNRTSIRTGGQGEGHQTVGERRGHCLLPLERQELALRDLCLAAESTTESICLTAMTSEAGRSLLPSDFFSHAYLRKTGRVLDEAAFRQLARSTSQWREGNASHLRSSDGPVDRSVIAATKTAYEARRNPLRPFGQYEFACATPPAQPIQLACKDWETAWHHPASIWLSQVVGVDEWPEGQLAWPRAMGTWVHRWLGAALTVRGHEIEPSDFLGRLRELVQSRPEKIILLARQAGVDLYPWWNHVSGQARSIALGLGESLAAHLQDRQVYSEYRLPRNLLVALPGSVHADFELRGRIDLVLLETTASSSSEGDFTNGICWVIDFKTGSAKDLNARKLEKGIGLQTLLYALAVRARGAGPVAVSLQTFDTRLKPQVQLDDALRSGGLFRSLEIFHRAGIFGMRPDAENDYGFAPGYPMATRPISASTLETKWELIHGAGALEEES